VKKGKNKMAYIKIYIHLVWSTKNREPYLRKKIRYDLFDHIRENAKTKNIHIDCINGYTDHVHCLVSLKPDQTIAKIMQLIKGESSFWLNREYFKKTKFEWQEEYFAVSVGESRIKRVRDYIKNQEEHHKKKTFMDEYNEFIEKYNFLLVN